MLSGSLMNLCIDIIVCFLRTCIRRPFGAGETALSYFERNSPPPFAVTYFGTDERGQRINYLVYCISSRAIPSSSMKAMVSSGEHTVFSINTFLPFISASMSSTSYARWV